MATTLAPLVIQLCQKWVERAEALKLKGVKCDDQCLAFFIGAGTGLALAGKTEEAAFVNTFAVFGVAFRGHLEVALKLREAQKEQ